MRKREERSGKEREIATFFFFIPSQNQQPVLGSDSAKLISGRERERERESEREVGDVWRLQKL